MGSWFGRKRGDKAGKVGKVVVDGSDIKELVENWEAFATFVNHKFQELDHDNDCHLSVQELKPVVANIGAALGLPTQGDSVETDHIFSKVLNEFTHGKQKDVSKSEFQEVLSDILVGLAAGLKRDLIIISRFDGEELNAFINSQSLELVVVPLFTTMESNNATLYQCLTSGLEQLTVAQGMPHASDPWERADIIEPALQSLPKVNLEQPVSQETTLEEFKKLLEYIVQRLREHHVIVAHSENIFDGSGIKKLLANKFELEKLLDSAWKEIPRDHKQKASK